MLQKKAKTLLLVILFILYIFSMGCSDDSVRYTTNDLVISSQTNVVTTELKIPSLEEAYAIIINEINETLTSSNNQGSPLIETIMEHLNLKVTGITPDEKENGSFIVSCNVQNYSVQETFESIINSHSEMTIDALYSEFSEIFPNTSLNRQDSIITIYQKEDGYGVQLTDEFVDVALGGFITYFGQLLESDS